MKKFQMFLDNIDDLDKRKRLEGILNNIKEKFPQLKEEIKWNQPMFSDHGTFIIGFSVAKLHIAVAPEAVVISSFEKDIEEAGYSHTQELFRIKWSDKDSPLINILGGGFVGVNLLRYNGIFYTARGASLRLYNRLTILDKSEKSIEIK